MSARTTLLLAARGLASTTASAPAHQPGPSTGRPLDLRVQRSR